MKSFSITPIVFNRLEPGFTGETHIPLGVQGNVTFFVRERKAHEKNPAYSVLIQLIQDNTRGLVSFAFLIRNHPRDRFHRANEWRWISQGWRHGDQATAALTRYITQVDNWMIILELAHVRNTAHRLAKVCVHFFLLLSWPSEWSIFYKGFVPNLPELATSLKDTDEKAIGFGC